ncbi:MAG: hypothetical protein FD145_760 [Candidatus Saganbacteria bacterium]|uniref:TIGR04255 family protein n=1 Tax=Candidatus Saganbacteria bacterium TaxID=2575572 RepID=A0A833NZZ3_UNCSA|nr:MAG: hypothetical protein FD145_760 [Candidatus Saganbacteria bacterium]
MVKPKNVICGTISIMGEEVLFNKPLGSAPIIEAVIGISVNRLFENKDEIKAAFDKTPLKNIYTTHKTTKIVSFQIDEKDGRTIAEDAVGFIFSKENESLFIEKNRITLSDRNKYQSFDELLKKYKYIWNEISPYIKNIENKEIIDIGIKCVNKFDLTAKDIDSETFLINPSISLRSNSTTIGKIQEFLAIHKIVSDKDKTFANVKTIMTALPSNVVKCIFEIDAHDNEKRALDFDLMESVLGTLRLFKNSIFFTNLPRADKMEQFK